MPYYAQDVKGYFQNSRQFYHLITDINARILHANEFFQHEIWKLDNETALDMRTLINEADLTHIDKLLQHITRKKATPHSTTLRYNSNDKKSKKICWEVSILKSEDQDNLLQWIGIEEHQSKSVFEEMGKNLDDIRERFNAYKQSSTGLWKVEMKEPMPINLQGKDAVDFCKKNAILNDCNEKTAAILGYSQVDDLLGKPLKDVLSFEDDRVFNYMNAFFKNNFKISNVEILQNDRYGNKIHLLHNITGVVENEHVQRIWGTVHDITLLKSMEVRLRESELFYRNLINDSLDGIFLTEENGNITFVSPSAERILGFGPADLKGINIFELVHPEDEASAKSVFSQGLQAEALFDFVNLRLKDKKGGWRWCMVRVHSMIDNPNVAGVIIYFADNSLRKEAEDALIASEQLFRTLIETINVGVQLTDANGTMMLFNPTALELLGLEEDEVIGKQAVVPYDILHEDGTPFSVDDYPLTISLREKIAVKNSVLGLRRKRQKDRVWLIVNSAPVLNDDGELQLVISSFSDITQHRKLILQFNEQEIIRQKQLLQVTIDAQEKERREIGRELHDNISQHLTITRLHLEVAKEMAQGPLSEAINLAHKSLLGIVNEIRKLSHSLVPPSINDIGLTASVQDLCDSLVSSGSYIIDFNHEGFVEDDIPENMKLTLYRIIQEQVNNIIRHSEATRIFVSLQVVDNTLLLFVEDNGNGFEVKKARKGMGFTNISNRAGLFGGQVRIDSAPGKGCVIEVEIPVLGQ